MKKLACVGLAAALSLTIVALTIASAQDRNLVWSAPAAPPREALDRLNLKLAWTAVVPTESQRDTIVTMQLTGNMLLVQTRSGLITAINGDTGLTIWRTRVGKPYQRPLPLAYNRNMVIAINGLSAFGIDRETGAELWQVELTQVPAAPPVAGEYQGYLCFESTDISAYLLPQAEGTAATSSSSEMASYLRGEDLADAYPSGTAARQPLLAWRTLARSRLQWAPVAGKNGMLYASPDGDIFAMEKFPVRTRKATELYRYRLTDSSIDVPPGHYENMAYIGSADSNVYAVDIDSGRVMWRFTSSTAIHRQPIATEKDVYVVSERLGLARVNRATGDAAWRLPRNGVIFPSNREADRFLAANPKFVYASDLSGRLLVLDRATGLRLSSYEGVRDFNVPFSNASTDRLIMAAHNGTIICMHDREYLTPYRHVKGEEVALDPQTAEVEQKLAKRITDAGREAAPLNTVLRDLLGEKNGNIKYVLADNAFKEAGITGVEDHLVTIPQVTNVTLRDLLRRVLAQADSRFQVVKDTVVIFPIVKKATP